MHQERFEYDVQGKFFFLKKKEEKKKTMKYVIICFYQYFFFVFIRSLQLTERSPIRNQQSHKVVVKVGNVPKERVSHTQIRNVSSTGSSNFRPNSRQYVSNNDRYKESRNSDLEKSRSLDSEYDKYKYNPAHDFDKSRSFDEDYAEKNDNNYITDPHFNIDQVYSKNKQPAPNQNSPQTYGSRLYDHEMMYDLARKAMDRSPILDFKRGHKHGGSSSSSSRHKRERSPNINREYRNQNRSRDHSPQNVSTLMINHSTGLGSNSSVASEYEIGNASADFDVEYDKRSNTMNEELIKEAKLVTGFMYGNKTKNDSYVNPRRRDTKTNRSAATAGMTTTVATSSGRYLRN